MTSTYFGLRSNLFAKTFVWEKVKTLYSETIAACGLKISRWSELMSKWNYRSFQGQDHSLTLTQGHSDMKIKSCFSQKLLGHL